MTASEKICAGQVGHVYVLRLKSEPNLFKIGRTGLGKLDARFSRLRVGELLEVVFTGIFLSYREWERVAHTQNRDVRLPQSEYFRLSASRLEDLLFALEIGTLEKEVASDHTPLLIQGDDSCLVVRQGLYDPLMVDYRSVDSFCYALADMQARIRLTPERAFYRASFR